MSSNYPTAASYRRTAVSGRYLLGIVLLCYPHLVTVGMWLSWLEHRTVTPLTQARFPGAARDFSPRVNFQCRPSYVCLYIPCAIACINICAHVKDPVVHVRV